MVRPVLVVSVPSGETDYALVGVVPLTATPRGSQLEIAVKVQWLQPGAFNVQGLLAVPAAKFLRKLGTLETAQLQQVDAGLQHWLGLS